MFKQICKNYCPYYREGKEDVGHCFPVLLFCDKELTYKDVKTANEIKRSLVELFCLRCEFYPEDCDFHALENTGSPCGGYIYFYHLLKKGDLSIEQLKELCETFTKCISKKT